LSRVQAGRLRAAGRPAASVDRRLDASSAA